MSRGTKGEGSEFGAYLVQAIKDADMVQERGSIGLLELQSHISMTS